MNAGQIQVIGVDRSEAAIPSSVQPEHVLIVDDDETTLSIMSDVIRELGLEVSTAENGEEAWNQFEQHKPDLVITDVWMPQGDGLSLTAQVIAREPSCPVIIVTGHGGEQAAIRALKAGATDYLVKPFQLTEFQMSVNRACSLIRARLQNERIFPAVTQTDHTVVLDNIPERVGGVIHLLLKTLEECVTESQLLHVRVVLQELLLNAIEHGNLNISSEEKSQAISENRFDQLMQERRNSSMYAKRRVYVSMYHDVDRGVLEFRVRDEGKGFDWESVLRGQADRLPMAAGSGRGIFLARTLIPQITYHHNGNKVSFTIHHSGLRQ